MEILSLKGCALTILLYQSIEKMLNYEITKISSEDTYSCKCDILENF